MHTIKIRYHSVKLAPKHVLYTVKPIQSRLGFPCERLIGHWPPEGIPRTRTSNISLLHLILAIPNHTKPHKLKHRFVMICWSSRVPHLIRRYTKHTRAAPLNWPCFCTWCGATSKSELKRIVARSLPASDVNNKAFIRFFCQPICHISPRPRFSFCIYDLVNSDALSSNYLLGNKLCGCWEYAGILSKQRPKTRTKTRTWFICMASRIILWCCAGRR